MPKSNLIKMHSSNFVGIILLREGFPFSLLWVFGAPYHGMVSEGLKLLRNEVAANKIPLNVHIEVNVI